MYTDNYILSFDILTYIYNNNKCIISKSLLQIYHNTYKSLSLIKLSHLHIDFKQIRFIYRYLYFLHIYIYIYS